MAEEEIPQEAHDFIKELDRELSAICDKAFKDIRAHESRDLQAQLWQILFTRLGYQAGAMGANFTGPNVRPEGVVLVMENLVKSMQGGFNEIIHTLKNQAETKH